MKRGDIYTNFGGEDLLIDYVERGVFISSHYRLIVRGVDDKDASKTLEETLASRKDEFRKWDGPDLIVHSKKYYKEREKEGQQKTKNYNRRTCSG